MKLRKKCLFAGLTAAVLILPSGCSAVSSEPMTYTDTLFDSVISVQIYDSKDEEILDGCRDLCQEYDVKFSRTNEESEVSMINSAQGNPVEVSPETATLIKKGLYYGKLSDGAFDITIGSVSRLWDFKAEEPALPDQAALAEALQHVDYKKVVVEGNTVKLQDPAAALDLGAVAKGYIADLLKEYLEGEGVHHALINLGGNVLAIGGKPDGSAFNIGIQKPFDESGIPLTSVRIKDKSIVTSGTYQRYFEKDGTLYHPHPGSLLGLPVQQRSGQCVHHHRLLPHCGRPEHHLLHPRSGKGAGACKPAGQCGGRLCGQRGEDHVFQQFPEIKQTGFPVQAFVPAGKSRLFYSFLPGSGPP